MVETQARPAAASSETRDGVRVIAIHNPPVNALSAKVSAALVDEIAAAGALSLAIHAAILAMVVYSVKPTLSLPPPPPRPIRASWRS